MEEIKFKRKIYDKLKKWKEISNGSTALMVEGARRVGKSTIVEEFGKNEYKSYILIRFDKAPKEVKKLFEDISDLNFLFLNLQMYYSTKLENRKSLIIFDEVQLCPLARQTIKALIEDGRYDYIETGSLISIKKNVEKIIIPSEEEFIEMHPMDYEEFLWAIGDTTTYSLLKTLYERNKPIGDDLNRKLMKDFRLYMLIGGMPQAVKAYIETNNFASVDKTKRSILKLYENDLKKIDSSGRLGMLFNAIPSQLNKNAKGFQTGKIINSYSLNDSKVYTLLSELNDSKIVNVCYHANNPDSDMASYKSFEQYKLYVVDTGLFVTMQYKNRPITENIIYEKLLNDSSSSNLGYLYENIVAQMVTFSGNELFYYSFNDKKLKDNYEIDFIINNKNKIDPIEVKSSNYRTHPSIDKFYEKFSSRISNRYIIDTKDIHKDKDIKCYPVYLLPFVINSD